MPKLLEKVRTFKGTDQQFHELVSELVTDLVSVLVIELEEGF